MNSPSNLMPESTLGSPAAPSATMAAVRPFYWSVRRELWENRSIYIAPLAVAAVTLLGFLIASIGRALSLTDPAQRVAVLAEPTDFAALLIMGTTFVVGIFYCLDALHGERRDRSILFWKSLPVSDLTTVLSKAAIPFVVLPLLTFAITVATQLIMLLLGSAVVRGSGLSASTLWSQASFFQTSLLLLYHLVTVHVFWYAPIYAWLLLVSGWAKRATFLWAALPWAAVCIVERIAFNTSHFGALLLYRLGGSEAGASFMAHSASMNPLMELTPGRFLASPGLWIGLAVAAIFLAAAVRLRRAQGPI
jgi:ABC-2 type transport system permease protein